MNFTCLQQIQWNIVLKPWLSFTLRTWRKCCNQATISVHNFYSMHWRHVWELRKCWNLPVKGWFVLVHGAERKQNLLELLQKCTFTLLCLFFCPEIPSYVNMQRLRVYIGSAQWLIKVVWLLMRFLDLLPGENVVNLHLSSNMPVVP